MTVEGRTFFSGRIKDKPVNAPIFTPMSYVDVSKAMRAASAAAQIEPRVTMHDLRRSYGSLLLNSGAPIEVVQELLGHSDSRMTRRVYGHLLQKTIADSVTKHLPSFTNEPKEK